MIRGILKWILLLHTDSEWSGDKDDRKSVGGFLLFVNGGMEEQETEGCVSINFGSTVLCACGSGEGDTICHPNSGVSWSSSETPVTVYVDNIGAIFMSENPSSSSRTHHMSTRYFYIMDLQNDKVIIVKFIGSAENLANIATKNVQVQVHEKHLNKVTAERSYVDG